MCWVGNAGLRLINAKATECSRQGTCKQDVELKKMHLLRKEVRARRSPLYD